MTVLLYLLAAVCGYLVGGINPAIAFSKRIYHQDIRACGSGNPGFTNFKRVFGNKWAWWVLLCDLIKGAAPTALFAWLIAHSSGDFQMGAAWTGLFALLGHAYPVWYRFRGGKGYLVYLSVVWVLDYMAGLVAVGVMLLLLLFTRYMSVSTVTALISCPITLALRGTELPVILLCALCVLYIAFRHKENFKRLKNGTESKFSVKSKTNGQRPTDPGPLPGQKTEK